MNINNQILQWRRKITDSDRVSPAFIDEITSALADKKDIYLPGEPDEYLDIVDKNGNLTGITCPRWICHLLALPHTVIHILLTWNSTAIGPVMICQVRSWNKSDSPGQVDITVGGHIKSGTDKLKAAYTEMSEEIGLTQNDILNPLQQVAQYKCTCGHEKNNLHDNEYRFCYSGRIKTNAMENIHFKDSEVVGIYLCPILEARNLLEQKFLPIARGLRYSLPYYQK